MQLPNISAMFKWVNNFFPGAKGGSQDFLQLIRESDGTILGWIDENGIPKGSLASSGGADWANEENVTFSGFTGNIAFPPNGQFFMLVKNGQILFNGIGYTMVGQTITLLGFPADPSNDDFRAWYTF